MAGDQTFTLIIPTFNRGTFIYKTIQSALKQKYPWFEIVVVDDGSTDNTEDVVKGIQSEKVRYFKKENGERGAARNFGIRQAKGDYLSFLDSDDILYEDYLSNASESLQRYSYPPFLHLAYEMVNEKGKCIRKINFIKSDLPEILVSGNPLSCLGIFVKREIAVAFQFNEDRRLAGSEDWELWLRIVANYGIKSDNRISAAMVLHNERSVLNTTEDKLVMRRNLSLKYAFADKNVERYYRRHRDKMEAYCDAYIALHLALSGKKRRALRYLLKGTLSYPPQFFSRRFFAIIKHCFIF